MQTLITMTITAVLAAFPFSGALSNGLRAAGDVKYTMYVSVVSTVVFLTMVGTDYSIF